MYREILEPIVRSPQLPILLKELEQIWKEEQIRRQEFYDWVTPDIKAEFIEGEIIVHSPVRSKHNTVLGNISRLIGVFVLSKDLGYIGVKKIMCRFSRNDYEPDMVFFDATTAKEFIEDQTIFPVPQLVVEVLSKSTEDRDRGVKFQDYESHNVQEYWIVDVKKGEIIAFKMENGGSYRIRESQVLPNLQLSVLEEALKMTRQTNHGKVGAWLLEKFSQ